HTGFESVDSALQQRADLPLRQRHQLGLRAVVAIRDIRAYHAPVLEPGASRRPKPLCPLRQSPKTTLPLAKA
ncbi:MAG: hypothetical protein KGI63_08085, partial [Xanthomonadaceae bacterium]|nr:hypothetical protein [Xanthomonadaceae bacterium]